jgi:hypothetical protein
MTAIEIYAIQEDDFIDGKYVLASGWLEPSKEIAQDVMYVMCCKVILKGV